MPSSSKKQHNFMAAVANNPAFAKKVGIPQSVGSDFTKADKGRTFAKGGDTMASKMNAGFAAMIAKKKGMKEGSKPEMAIDKKMGMTKMAKGGAVKDIGGTNAIGRSGGIPAAKNANRTGGDLSGKLTKSSMGEGVEKGYKPNTKTVKSKGGDGIAQRGRTKPQASKEM